MPTTVSPESSAAASPLHSPAVLAPSRFQVRTEQWGNLERFVVGDTWTDTTVAIRSTRRIADGDLMRLNMGIQTGPDRPLPAGSSEITPSAVTDDAPSAQVTASTDRQCGRCRQMFPADTASESTGTPDWWLCDPCHNTLFANSPRTDRDARNQA